MAFSDIAKRIKYPRGLSQRYRDQDCLLRFLNGTFYDDAKLTSFDMERTGGGSYGEYIKLRERRPSVVSNFARQFVEQTIGLLWADEQFPVLRVYEATDPDKQKTDVEKKIQYLIERCALDEVLARVTYLGSIGSVAVVVRGLDGDGLRDGAPWIEVWRGYQCVPVFDKRNPTILSSITTIYPTTGEILKLAGEAIPDDELTTTFWVRIKLDDKEETRYKPMRQDLFERMGEMQTDGKRIEWEPAQSYPHKFGVVPAIWGKAPNASHLELDGPCVFNAAVDTIVELDYQLSQIGRAYKYTMDPMIAVRRGEIDQGSYSPSGSRPSQTQKDDAGNMIKSATNIVDVEPGGDAKLLELAGSGLAAALEYVQSLREYALESIGGMKSDSETQKGAQSGKALEILYQALVIVIKRLRLTWGNHVLLPLVELLLRGINAGEIKVPGVESIDPETIVMRLKWPQWMTPTGTDFFATVQGWNLLAGGSIKEPVAIFDRDTVTRLAATNLGFQDAEAMVKQVSDQRDDDAEQEAQETQQQMEHQVALKAAAAPKPSGAAA